MKKTSNNSSGGTNPTFASRQIKEDDLPKDINPPAGQGQLPIDIFENEKEIFIVAPIPGVDMEQAEIVVSDDVLTIKGKREVNLENFALKKEDHYVQECFWGSFSRSVILPPNANINQIEATQKEHILYIQIPKRENMKMRIVKIKS